MADKWIDFSWAHVTVRSGWMYGENDFMTDDKMNPNALRKGEEMKTCGVEWIYK